MDDCWLRDGGLVTTLGKCGIDMRSGIESKLSVRFRYYHGDPYFYC